MDEHNSEIINIVQKIDTDLHPKIIFLRKLYFMMFLQTIVAGVVNETVSLCPEFLGLLESIPNFLQICIAMTLFLIFVSLILRNSLIVPLNMIFYLVFTISFSFTFTCLIQFQDKGYCTYILTLIGSVYLALLMNVFSSKNELSYQNASIAFFGTLLVTFQLFLMHSQMVFNSMIYGMLASLVFAYLLIYDTQTDISGKYYNWKQDDWVLGSVAVYGDVFILILRITDLIRPLITKMKK